MHNLLIIDDEDNIIGLLQEYFSQLGYRVMSAKDGKEGIELFNSDANFDLVITGITLPGIDGNAVAKCIKNSQRPEVPIVAMSRYNDRADDELFDFTLEKPFNLKELMTVVKLRQSKVKTRHTYHKLTEANYYEISPDHEMGNFPNHHNFHHLV